MKILAHNNRIFRKRSSYKSKAMGTWINDNKNKNGLHVNERSVNDIEK